MDKWWEWGFITNEEEYLAQRLQLKEMVQRSRPQPVDPAGMADAILEHFSDHWKELANNQPARADLIRLLVDRVYVLDREIFAVTFCSGHHLLVEKQNWVNQLPD